MSDEVSGEQRFCWAPPTSQGRVFKESEMFSLEMFSPGVRSEFSGCTAVATPPYFVSLWSNAKQFLIVQFWGAKSVGVRWRRLVG